MAPPGNEWSRRSMGEPCCLGGCLCGGVRYQVSGAVSNPCFCHCASCRKAAGAPMVPWGTFARASLRLSRGALAEYRSSPGVTRGFCAVCGTSLTYHNEAREVPHTAQNPRVTPGDRSEEHTSELQSKSNLVCRLLLV